MFYLSLSSSWVVLFFQAWLFPNVLFNQALLTNAPPEKYRIEIVSKLNMAGTTNINSFNCMASEIRSQSIVTIYGVGLGDEINFDHPEIQVFVPSMDCGQSGINRDMQKTLKAEEYPFIRISVISARLDKQQDWVNGKPRSDIRANTLITITNKSRMVEIPMNAIKKDENIFQFQGSTTLRLTDFGIDPPKVLLGLIEVNDKVVVSFDITAQAN